MADIVVVGHDTSILHRWTQAVREAGHVSTILIAGELHRSDSPICLFDLGAGIGASANDLIDALAAEPDIRFVAMVARPNADEGLALLRAGVKGYCNRLASPTVLAALISTGDAGEIWAGKQVTDHLLQLALGEELPVYATGGDLFTQLTPREASIARQVGMGFSNKVIAADNEISERTVKAHLNAIYRKTGLRNRVQLALEIAQTVENRRKRTAGRS